MTPRKGDRRRDNDVSAQAEPRREPTTTAATAPRETTACQQLVAEMRLIKHTSGLSFARLQTHTHYSRASLERYVNGKLFPPRHAVESIARACGAADPQRLLALWDVAAHAGAPPALERPASALSHTPAQPSAPARLPQAASHTRRRAADLAGLPLVLALLLLCVGDVAAADNAAGNAARPAASPSWCRDYYADIRVYTMGRMCWTSTQVTVTGYVKNQAERLQATAQLCISSHRHFCAQIIDLAVADSGQTTHYAQTVHLASGYGAWVRACSEGYCTEWR